jgi:hypothetical protein
MTRKCSETQTRKRSKAPDSPAATEPAAVTPPRSRRLPLRTVAQIRNEMARTYRRFDAGQVDRMHANTATFVLSALVRVIEGSDLEARIEALEQQGIEHGE